MERAKEQDILCGTAGAPIAGTSVPSSRITMQVVAVTLVQIWHCTWLSQHRQAWPLRTLACHPPQNRLECSER